MDKVIIYTDGACSGNPGPGGWGALLVWGKKALEISGHEDHTTNQRMELTAVIKALERLKRPCDVIVYTDSQYVVGVMTQGWKRRANLDLLERLDKLCQIHQVEFKWVRGHNGNRYNEWVNRVAQEAVKKGG